MTLNARAAILFAALAAAHAAHAASAAEVAATADIGTTGLGLHLSTPLATNLNARIGINVANYSYDGNTSDVDYDFKLKLATADALLDWHPFAGSFRISGGVVYNGNKIDARARPNAAGSYDINGSVYSAASVGRPDGRIDFRKAAPYLGIGWGNAVKQSGWSVGLDLGVSFQGSPKTALASSGCTASAGTCAQLARDVAAENVRLADEVDGFKFYPVVRAGVSYRF